MNIKLYPAGMGRVLRTDFALEGGPSRSCCLCINIVPKPEAKRISHVELKKENKH